MNFIPYISVILGAIALVFFIILRDGNGSVPALILKTITSFMFLATATAAFMVNFAADNATFYMLIMMGLVCGLIGDIVLDLKIIYKESSSLYQHAGMISFFLGHVFYISALYIYFGFHWLPLVIAIVIALAIILTSKYVFKFDFKEHTIDTYAYSFLLSYMMTQSIYAAIVSSGSSAMIIMAIGAVLFLLSDLVLSMTYYDGKDGKPFIAVNHILYYGAQFLIALSVLYLI